MWQAHPRRGYAWHIYVLTAAAQLLWVQDTSRSRGQHRQWARMTGLALSERWTGDRLLHVYFAKAHPLTISKMPWHDGSSQVGLVVMGQLLVSYSRCGRRGSSVDARSWDTSFSVPAAWAMTPQMQYINTTVPGKQER